jgi:hypothetical protein
MVLSTALFGKPAFRNLICNGLVLAEDGKKMSKSLKNYPSPLEVIDNYGAVSTKSFYQLSFSLISYCVKSICLSKFVLQIFQLLAHSLVYVLLPNCRMHCDCT